MILKEKLPQGSIYPQITQVPISTYTDFLNFFRAGHTIDDNLEATAIASTMHATMLKTAIASGHLKKTKNMIEPNGLADIVLSKPGLELIQTFFDRQFCEAAVVEAKKSVAEKDDRLHPYVGAVVVKDGKRLAAGYRGETGEGRHAEYCALRKINDDVDNVDLSGCTVYTTLEPCSIRKTKTPCTKRLIDGKVARVVYGLADKDETVYGHASLVEARIEVGLFPDDLMQELLVLNKAWSDSLRVKPIVPPNNASPLATVSYYKLGTSMADNTHFYVRPPKDAAGFFTIEDAVKNVLAHGKTIEEIAMQWHRMDDQKVIMEKLVRQGSGSNHRFLTLT
ncbi:MAG: deaminase [Terriglobales bacterium]